MCRKPSVVEVRRVVLRLSCAEKKKSRLVSNCNFSRRQEAKFSKCLSTDDERKDEKNLLQTWNSQKSFMLLLQFFKQEV